MKDRYRFAISNTDILVYLNGFTKIGFFIADRFANIAGYEAKRFKTSFYV